MSNQSVGDDSPSHDTVLLNTYRLNMQYDEFHYSFRVLYLQVGMSGHLCCKLNFIYLVDCIKTKF